MSDGLKAPDNRYLILQRQAYIEQLMAGIACGDLDAVRSGFDLVAISMRNAAGVHMLLNGMRLTCGELLDEIREGEKNEAESNDG